MGPFALAKFVQMVRTVFHYAYKSGHIEVPIRYGDEFHKPPKRVMRLGRQVEAARVVEPRAVWQMLVAAWSFRVADHGHREPQGLV